MLDAMIRHIYTSSSCVCVDDEFLFIKQISRCCRRWLKTNRQLCVHFLLVLLYVFSPPPSSAAAAAIYFSNVIFLLRVRVCVCWGRSAKKRRHQQQPREGAASLLSASLRLNLLPLPSPSLASRINKLLDPAGRTTGNWSTRRRHSSSSSSAR